MLSVRQLEPADAAAFLELRVYGLETEPTAFSSSPEEERGEALERIGARLADPEGAMFGAFWNGTLCGLTGIRRECALKLRHKAFIWGVFVHPDHRRHGAGRALIAAAIAHAQTWPGVDQLSLSVNETNVSAQRLYESFGFEVFGREARYMIVDGVAQDERHMTLNLDRR